MRREEESDERECESGHINAAHVCILSGLIEAEGLSLIELRRSVKTEWRVMTMRASACSGSESEFLATAVISTTSIGRRQRGLQSVSRAEFERWKTELSNWGRWGKDDQLGALNLITPAKRRQAAALVHEGFSVSLSRDADRQKAIDNPDPFEHSMIDIGSDRMGVIPHGVAHTHSIRWPHQYRRRLLQRLTPIASSRTPIRRI